MTDAAVRSSDKKAKQVFSLTLARESNRIIIHMEKENSFFSHLSRFWHSDANEESKRRNFCFMIISKIHVDFYDTSILCATCFNEFGMWLCKFCHEHFAEKSLTNWNIHRWCSSIWLDGYHHRKYLLWYIISNLTRHLASTKINDVAHFYRIDIIQVNLIHVASISWIDNFKICRVF